MNTVRAPQRERDGAVWKDDSVEIFIARGDQGEVFQFAVNAAGSRMDAAYGKSQLSDISWNASPDWQAAAAMEISPSTVCRIENAHEMTITVVLKACAYLQMHPFAYFKTAPGAFSRETYSDAPQTPVLAPV